MIIQYTLTMPNKGSWDGKWTGEGKLYAICRRYSNTIAKKIMQNLDSRNWNYRWDDGWSANIKAVIISAKDAAKIRKKSAGFCGYDWMIDSIEKVGSID